MISVLSIQRRVGSLSSFAFQVVVDVLGPGDGGGLGRPKRKRIPTADGAARNAAAGDGRRALHHCNYCHKVHQPPCSDFVPEHLHATGMCQASQLREALLRPVQSTMSAVSLPTARGAGASV